VSRRSRAGLATGLLAGVLADAFLGDPARAHPVAGFGRLAAQAERAMWRPSAAGGAAHLVLLVAPLLFAARRVDRFVERRPWLRAGYTALCTWTVVGAATLGEEAGAVERLVATGDLPAARRRLASLCGRDAGSLDAAGLRRAVIESVAENTSDGAVAPLFWGALCGPAGLLGYRAVNTLDSMVGHPDHRYCRFGMPAARADDLANLLPARLTALIAAVLAPAVRGSTRGAFAAWRRDAPAHPSPNAGPCEAAFAGALGITLGGPTVYAHGTSNRPRLGEGPAPDPADVGRAVKLSRLVVVTAAAVTAATAVLAGP
jgi:adenosylcobinamide-phosphate synthase